MLAVSEKVEHYLQEFDRLEKETDGRMPGWIENLRASAIQHFERLGFPTTRDEDWRFTNVKPIFRTPFRYSAEGLSTNTIEAFRFREPASEIVFVNGIYSPSLSCTNNLPNGTILTSLAGAIVLHPDLIEPHLARYADWNDGFTALNTAFLHDGAFIYIPDGSILQKPLHLVFLSGSERHPRVNHPRNLIVTGKGTAATIVETYLSDSSEVYFTNAVTEVVAGEATTLHHYKVQRESEKSFHIATTEVHQMRNSMYHSLSLTIGAEIARNNLNVILDGEGAECSLDGLYLIGGKQHADNHTAIDHARPHCTSHEFYKGVLSGKSGAVFNGKIVVQKDAQKTDARQTNKNLLLSEGTHVNTKPQLEIRADDVKCTHGATIGQLDLESLFYLKSRGINDHLARRLLTYGFAREVLDDVSPDYVREVFDEIIVNRLDSQTSEEPQDPVVGRIQISEGGSNDQSV